MITDAVINRLSNDTKELFDFYDKKGLRKSDKQKSEDISGLLETAMEDLIDGAVAPKVDSEPDIRLNGNPVEIKTSSGETWRGGAYSKRGGHFIFVTWSLDKNNVPSLFLAGIDLVESDWKLSGSANYYEPHMERRNFILIVKELLFIMVLLKDMLEGNRLVLEFI